MTMTLTSPAFHEGQPIPRRYTGDGDDVSPPLQWTDPPAGTESLALICEDPDAPRGTWSHWVAFNLPAESRGLAEGTRATEGLPDGTAQGKNDFGNVGYGGPAPPPGKPHRYVFRLFALDARPDLKAGASRRQLLDAIDGHVLAEARLTGTYARQS